jgi:hypothetical protein
MHRMVCHPCCMAVEKETTGNRTVFRAFNTSNSIYIPSSPVTVVTSCLTSVNQIQGGFLPDACVGSRLAIQPCVGSALPMKHVLCLRWTQYKISLYRTGTLDPALLITSVLRHPLVFVLRNDSTAFRRAPTPLLTQVILLSLTVIAVAHDVVTSSSVEVNVKTCVD